MWFFVRGEYDREERLVFEACHLVRARYELGQVFFGVDIDDASVLPEPIVDHNESVERHY